MSAPRAFGAALALALAGHAPAQQPAGGPYLVPRQSIDGGGRIVVGAVGGYTLRGSLGQPDAGPALASATYTLRGGFQRAAGGDLPTDALFGDGFEPSVR